MKRIIYTILVLTSVVSAKECPELEAEGVPSFTIDVPNEEVWVRNGHFAELECCMSGHDDVVWYRLDKEKRAWKVYNISDMDENRVEFINNRQVLIIKSAEIDDEGTYMCRPKQNDTVFKDISRKFSVQVQACDPLARGPYAIAPFPCDKTACTVGEDLTLQCNAYFGCSDGDEPRLVKWFVSRDTSKEPDWTPVEEFDPRFKVDRVQYGNSAEIHTNLTITGVTTQDYNLRFRCLLASAQILHGQTDIYVKLVKGQSDSAVEMKMDTASITLVAAGAGALIIVVVLILVVVTVEQGRRTRRHVSNDIKRKLSGDMRPLAYADV